MKIGLVLSGGGSRGFAHLGVLKAMNELSLEPDYVSGSSSGALVGAFYCNGYSPDQISEIILERGIFKNLKFAFNRFGIFSLAKVEKLILEYIPHNSFENLKIPLTVCATDIKKGESKYFDGGELANSVLASCSIPGIFSPTIIDGKKYIDGGVLNNMPFEPIKEKVDCLIGVNVMPIEKKLPVGSAKEILIKCMLLTIGNQSSQKINSFDVYIEPDQISHFNGLKITEAKRIFELGYEKAMVLLPGLINKRRLENKLGLEFG